MPWKVITLKPAEDFLLGLDAEEYTQFDAAMKFLEQHGPNLGEPFVKRIVASKHSQMKELRRQSKGKIFRILFAFDIKRRAVLLLGGDKAEIGFDDFYTANVPIADELFTAHQKACELEDETEKATKAGKSIKKKGKKNGR